MRCNGVLRGCAGGALQPPWGAVGPSQLQPARTQLNTKPSGAARLCHEVSACEYGTYSGCARLRLRGEGCPHRIYGASFSHTRSMAIARHCPHSLAAPNVPC